LRGVRDALRETQQAVTAKLQGQYTENRDLITRTEQLREPLELCYRSLQACGMSIIADGMLLDVMRNFMNHDRDQQNHYYNQNTQ
jgi:phosphoenolpyruvate carboxylase